ncbi:MAG: DUF3617 domain-containing protein [Bacteriovoracia bacterium]
MKSIPFLLLFSATVSHAALDMKPGLWEMSLKLMDERGKEVDAAQIAEKGATNKICYTKEMIENPQSLSGKDECETKISKMSKTELFSTYKCEDGIEGDMEFKLKDSQTFTMTTNTRYQEKKIRMRYYGKFISSDCGKVKPLNL